MKLFISTLLVSFAVALSACVSEEGARKHAMKGETASRAGVMPGMVWKAVVYNSASKESLELGRFESRDECHQANQAHMVDHKQPEKGHLASACEVVESDS